MSLWILIGGTFWLIVVTGFAFLMIALSGAAPRVGKSLEIIGGFTTFAIPALSALSIAMLWKAQPFMFGYSVYWWLVFPLPFIICYMIYWSYSE